MIISPGRRYIFVHIPKTGGTALTLALEARAQADDILIGDTPKAIKRRKRLKSLTPAGRLWKHSTLADIDGVVEATAMNAFKIVTLVRNPWDRLVSYYHWLQSQSFAHPAVLLSQTHDFAGFLQNPQICNSIQRSPAGSYVTDANGKERKSLFLRLEHLAKDLGPFEDHLGFTLDIPHANKSARDADYRGYYSDKTRDLVAEICAADISRFGYTF